MMSMIYPLVAVSLFPYPHEICMHVFIYLRLFINKICCKFSEPEIYHIDLLAPSSSTLYHLKNAINAVAYNIGYAAGYDN